MIGHMSGHMTGHMIEHCSLTPGNPGTFGIPFSSKSKPGACKKIKIKNNEKIQIQS